VDVSIFTSTVVGNTTLRLIIKNINFIR